MYSIDTYVSKDKTGFKFNTTNTLLVVGFGFLIGYAYCASQKPKNYLY